MRDGAKCFLSLTGLSPDLGRVNFRRLWKLHRSRCGPELKMLILVLTEESGEPI